MANTNNSINNTITQANFSVNQNAAGTGTTFTLSQTNNTNTGSSSNLLIKVGGTSGGDAFTTYTVTGSTSWSEGNNNPNQQYLICPASKTLNVTSSVQISSSSGSIGMINYPLQPVFSAYLSTNTAAVTGNGATYTILFNTISYDQNNNYSATAGTFTAPITGIYFFSTTATLDGITPANGEVRLTFFHSAQAFRSFKGQPFNASTTLDLLTCSGTSFFKLTAGDTVSVQVTVFNGTSLTVFVLGGNLTTNLQTFFQGYLIA